MHVGIRPGRSWMPVALAFAAGVAFGSEGLAPGLPSRIDAIVEGEIAKGGFPGAVIAVGRREGVVFLRAYGHAVVHGGPVAMRTDTIFDIASLTKCVATAPAVLLLAEQGRLALDDPAERYLPGFAAHGKQAIRIRHLLAHDSGLPAYTGAAPLSAAHGPVCPDAVLRAIGALEPLRPPGDTFRYSCLGYIVLGRITEVAAARPLDEFVREHLFVPIGMADTGYKPPPALRTRLAGTEVRDGSHPVGEVHDPLARLMGGVSGNAGVFSTAPDLSRYCRMLLGGGRLDGRQVLAPRSVELLTTPQAHARAYGFDVGSSHAWIKGDALSPAAFCHSGYTGTSIVCDPLRNLFVVILTNRVHPDDRGSVRTLRTAIADLLGRE